MDDRTRNWGLSRSDTRRALFARHLKGIGVVASAALIEGLLSTRKAAAVVQACFLRGTRILTDAGERDIERLKIGDLVPTAFGELLPIKFIETYKYEKGRGHGPWPIRLRPVRITKSAISNGVPHRDLYVTRGHALYLDGALIPAGLLVNGKTILLHSADDDDELEFFHIKLERHSVIFAEGAACETLLKDAADVQPEFGARPEHGARIAHLSFAEDRSNRSIRESEASRRRGSGRRRLISFAHG